MSPMTVLSRLDRGGPASVSDLATEMWLRPLRAVGVTGVDDAFGRGATRRPVPARALVSRPG